LFLFDPDVLNPDKMAEEMMSALAIEMREVTEPDKLKPLFKTIAQGIIKHLKDNPGAFKCSGQVSGGSCTGQVVEVNTDGLEKGW